MDAAEHAQTETRPAAPAPPADDAALLDRLRRGDEAAFAALIDRYHGALLRLAQSFVPSRAVAEEVVQEAWIGVLEGIDRFEGRSSLKTWIFRILINQAKTRGARERRLATPAADPGAGEAGAGAADEPAVDPARFQSHGPWIGHWAEPPRAWDDQTPERLLLSKEAGALLERAIEALPPTQRQVILLHDVQGVEPKEICALLEVTEVNLRVLLHRARSRVRRALETYIDRGGGKP
jgi:RNA polymerase sigma-70 factor (ECF subfamily)